MTIDEAIKRNTNIQLEFLPLPRHRDWEAIQLGIEALKRHREQCHHFTWNDLLAPLLGETKE